MWHVIVGVVMLAGAMCLLFIGLYKLSGNNDICKRGRWSRDEGESENVGNDNVNWLELQVGNGPGAGVSNGIVVNK